MADDRLDLAPGYDPEADPLDVTRHAPRGYGDVVDGLRAVSRLRRQQKEIDAKIKAWQRQLVPHIWKPVLMVENGKRVLALASQARPIKVDPTELFNALVEYGIDEIRADIIVGDVCKPREVDCSEDGLLVQWVQDGVIPMEVYAKVAREKPSSAYIQFKAAQ